MMKLIGSYRSPFTRRVAVSLNVLGLPFELEELLASQNRELVARYNPLKRIPALVLEGGEILVESYAILDAIDDIVGPNCALTPSTGPERRHVMKLTSIALGTIEKAQCAHYEGRYHPPEKVNQSWIDQNEDQVLSGLAYLNEIAGAAGRDGWVATSSAISQADITGTVAFSFVKVFRPHLDVTERYPALSRLAEKCEAMDAFSQAAESN